MFGLIWNSILRQRLGISEAEILPERRGFRSADSKVLCHLTEVGRYFLHGYHEALDQPPERVAEELTGLKPEYRGFAFEGAAMALTLLDSLTMNRRRLWSRFIAGGAAVHRYVCHIGRGWALARLPWTRYRPEGHLDGLDSQLRWLAIDGFGFHEGFFHWRRWLPSGRIPSAFRGYAARAFDQGLGRSLWFISGADCRLAASMIQKFETRRQADLWSGLGLACCYAGMPTATEMQQLMQSAGTHLSHLQQGVCFGSEARHCGGIQTQHTELACRVICDMSIEEAVNLTHLARCAAAPDSPQQPAYENWRQGLRDFF